MSSVRVTQRFHRRVHGGTRDASFAAQATYGGPRIVPASKKDQGSPSAAPIGARTRGAKARKADSDKRTERLAARLNPAVREALTLAAVAADETRSTFIERLIRDALEGQGYGCWVYFDAATAKRLKALAQSRGQKVPDLASAMLKDAVAAAADDRA